MPIVGWADFSSIVSWRNMIARHWYWMTRNSQTPTTVKVKSARLLNIHLWPHRHRFNLLTTKVCCMESFECPPLIERHTSSVIFFKSPDRPVDFHSIKCLNVEHRQQTYKCVCWWSDDDRGSLDGLFNDRFSCRNRQPTQWKL